MSVARLFWGCCECVARLYRCCIGMIGVFFCLAVLYTVWCMRPEGVNETQLFLTVKEVNREKACRIKPARRAGKH